MSCSQLQLTLCCFPLPALNLLAFNIGVVLHTLQNPWSITLVCSRNQHLVKEQCVPTEHNLTTQAYFLFCKAYDLPAFPVTEQVYWLYLAFLVGSFSSYNSVNNYLSCLKQVNLYLGVDITFVASSQINFLKQAAKRVLPKPVGCKLPIFKLLDFRHPLHVCMWTIYSLHFSHCCVNLISPYHNNRCY